MSSEEYRPHEYLPTIDVCKEDMCLVVLLSVKSEDVETVGIDTNGVEQI